MQLIRTTVRIKAQLKKLVEMKAFEDETSFQVIVNHALERYLEEEGKKEAKKIVFKTHNLGKPLDNLKRADYYQ